MEVSTQPGTQQFKPVYLFETSVLFVFITFYDQMWLNKNGSVFVFLSGGTSVSSALECPPEETRSIVSLDTSQMVGTSIHSDHSYT